MNKKLISKAVFVTSTLTSILVFPVLSYASSVITMPSPASAHTITPYLKVPSTSSTSKPLEIATSAGNTQESTPSQPSPEVNIENIIENTSVNTYDEAYSEQNSLDPYALEQQYTLSKDPRTIPKNIYVASQQPKPRKKIVRKIQQPVQKTRKATSDALFLTTAMGPLEGEHAWQATNYKFSPDKNIIVYPQDSPLKMITLQFFVEVSSGISTARKTRILLEKINNALPNAVLVAGLRELGKKDPLYILSQWNRGEFTKAIQKVSSTLQKENIGENLRGIRTSLLNIQTPACFVLVTDGENYNSDNLQFDLKLFYAPDPRFPLYIVSFATTKAEQKTIQLIKNVHEGSIVFNGETLLEDSGAFTQFMKKLFVK